MPPPTYRMASDQGTEIEMKKAVKTDPGGRTQRFWREATPYGVGIRLNGFQRIGFHTLQFILYHIRTFGASGTIGTFPYKLLVGFGFRGMSILPCAVADPTVSVLRLSHYTNTAGDWLVDSNDRTVVMGQSLVL
jgi:hypothetical protein